MSASDLPTLNALLNSASAVLLTVGYRYIRRGDRRRHRNAMLGAAITSALFLTSYVAYHATAGSVPYPRQDWTRPVYFAVLAPHVVLAAVLVPFAVAALYLAGIRQYARHARLTRWVWPVWMFVSVSGVAVYLMLYHLAGAGATASGAADAGLTTGPWGASGQPGAR